MIAFGGAAPLHAARLAQKIGVRRVVVPPNAGVGSAIGFLAAPISYEMVRTTYMRLGGFDHAVASLLLREMADEVRGWVAQAAYGAELLERRVADNCVISVKGTRSPSSWRCASLVRTTTRSCASATNARTRRCSSA